MARPNTVATVSAGVAATVSTASAGTARSLSSSGAAGTARPGSFGAKARHDSLGYSPSSSSGDVSIGALATLISRAVAEGMGAAGVVGGTHPTPIVSSIGLEPLVSGVASVPLTSAHPPASGELSLVVVVFPGVHGPRDRLSVGSPSPQHFAVGGSALRGPRFSPTRE